MVFSSAVFLFIFLPVVFVLNLLLPGKHKNMLLLVASLFFYAWGEPVYVVILLLSIIVNYLLALGISKRIEERGVQTRERSFLGLAIILNLALLIVFKYMNFIADNFSVLTGIPIELVEMPLPVGISFFTFQGISYVMDVYRGRTRAQRKLSHVALYISYFPQLIAGPVVRYRDIAKQIESRTQTVEKMASGLRRFAVGLGKKILIANAMGRIADMVFASNVSGITTSEAWAGALAYTLQIYFDFSGYSDMAIGLGRLFGFEIMENFNYPFIARSIKNFWRRWHISLSSWFKDYLYIPLGGNRKGNSRTYLNLSLVFLLTGFWHGAEWTFIIWGMFHGAFTVIERIGLIKPEKLKPRFLANIYTLLVVISGFVIFRSESLSQAGGILKAMFFDFTFVIRNVALAGAIFSPSNIIILVVACLASTPLLYLARDRVAGSERLYAAMDATGYVLSLALVILCVLALAMNTYNPFIYFRF